MNSISEKYLLQFFHGLFPNYFKSIDKDDYEFGLTFSDSYIGERTSDFRNYIHYINIKFCI